MSTLIEQLAERWPQCFQVYERRRRPLKSGIRRDIEAALDGAVTRRDLKNALTIYCGNWAYLRACVEGADRIDLDGLPVGKVTAEEAQRAAERLQQYRDRRKARSADPAPTIPAAIIVSKSDAAVARAPPVRRLSLGDLKAAAMARRQINGGAAKQTKM
jgi:ProP effector